MLSRQHGGLPVFRVEVAFDAAYRRNEIHGQLQGAGFRLAGNVEVRELYFLQGDLHPADVDAISSSLILDPVTGRCTIRQVGAQDGVESFNRIEVTFKPGVTDSIAERLLAAAHEIGVAALRAARSGISYRFSQPLAEDTAHRLAQDVLANATVQDYAIGEILPVFLDTLETAPRAARIPVTELDEAGLLALSASRRLSLDLQEMQTIQAYFQQNGREPTDAELETIAQTWSEHCMHKTFKASIRVQGEEDVVPGLIASYLRAATERIAAPWVRSAFVDNAGVIEFDDNHDLSFKVETHNHPSAIEPFGGANTGVGGVVRDILGVSHRPIALTDVLCFGPQDIDEEALPPGVLHPRRVQDGVVRGIADFGNKLGIPTVNGSILYHPGYAANPLVYCGCVGIGPRDSHPRRPHPGERIIVLGGATGRDGLRGATFSSQVLDADTGEQAGASLQIGDPITEKGLIEVVERARNARLYTAITDCGAGGLSSAVGEMAAGCGARVDLADVRLKYPGLAPWEIWLSEAQERMVLAVPEENLRSLQDLCDAYEVPLSDIGAFEQDCRLRVVHGDEVIVDLANEFLHHGLPLPELNAVCDPLPGGPPPQEVAILGAVAADEAGMLLALLGHPDIASKEDVIRRYDHEVRGAAVIRPLTGPLADGPSDAAVLKPAESTGWLGFAVAHGIRPHLGEIDPYHMAVSAVDEAIRNAVAAGADPERIALLDNFCWGDPNSLTVLGGLVSAVRGCHDAALHYRAPFISGKDSLYNEYVDPAGVRRSIPGTLLISSIAIVPDIRQAVSMDLKEASNLLYLAGDWQGARAGCHADLINPAFLSGQLAGLPGRLPDGAPRLYRAVHAAMRLGWVRSAHDLSEGGLGVALAEMALAGRMGLRIALDGIHPQARLALFAETNGCLVVEIPPERQRDFEAMMGQEPIILLGRVTGDGQVRMLHGGQAPISLPVEALAAAFTGRGPAQ
jgi:phosphoribosylformylglycinamidine synthase